MSQWDVHANPSVETRNAYPYVVVVQSDLLDVLKSRLVIPPTRNALAPVGLPARLCPTFDIAGQRCRLVPQEQGVVAARALAPSIVSLRAESHRIVDAIDAVISGV